MLWDILVIIVACVVLVTSLSKNKKKTNPAEQQTQPQYMPEQQNQYSYTPVQNPQGKFCPYCGRAVESADHQFCPGCGNRV